MSQLKSLIRTIPDFPQPGIQFRDLTTLFLHADGFRQSVKEMADAWRGEGIEMVVGVESRGFIVAAPVALELGVGFVPIRKPGKLPGETFGVEYTLEYGEDRLEIHMDALGMGTRVLLVDDLLATGGTMEAACRLVERIGCQVAGCAFVVELPDLRGRDRLGGYKLTRLVEFEGD
ncbi:MAG TPA: adenine phosphoribosyltransferase [bacterium]|nr:adenine phosphoribosyltransferase [bacterium]